MQAEMHAERPREAAASAACRLPHASPYPSAIVSQVLKIGSSMAERRDLEKLAALRAAIRASVEELRRHRRLIRAGAIGHDLARMTSITATSVVLIGVAEARGIVLRER